MLTTQTVKPKISACIVAYNHDQILDRCLGSLKNLVDEIIVVHDGPCSDRSLEIAKSYGAKVFVKEHLGAGDGHRPFAFEQTTGEWVLKIDPDEFLTSEATAKIIALVESNKADAYFFWWPYWDGKNYFTRGPFSKEYKLSLFKKVLMYDLGLVHEYPRTYGRTSVAKEVWLHHEPPYNNFSTSRFWKKWGYWGGLRANQIVNLESVPTFNIVDPASNLVISHYKKVRQLPLLFAFLEPLKAFLIYIKRGLLWSGLEDWGVALLTLGFHFYQNFLVWKVRNNHVKFNQKS